MLRTKNQPSEEALINMCKFLMKTSVPRILAKREAKQKEGDNN